MTARDPLYLDGVISAEEARLGTAAGWTAGASGILARTGVVSAPGTPLRVHQTPTASGNLLVDAGAAVVQGTSSAIQGAYIATNDAQITLTYLGAFPADANPRKDVIVARINDDDYAGATNGLTIEVIKGTAAGSPVDPALPVSCIPLARINLPASATTVADAVIDDLRNWTVARGGVLPVGSVADIANPYVGQPAYDGQGRVLFYDGARWNTPVPNIAPAYSRVTVDPGATSGATALTLATTAVTCDGFHDVEVDFTWYGASLSVADDRFDVQLFAGATQVGAVTVRANGTGFQPGTPVRAIVQAPGAGSLTIAAKIQRASGTGTADVFASSSAPMLLTAKQFV